MPKPINLLLLTNNPGGAPKTYPNKAGSDKMTMAMNILQKWALLEICVMFVKMVILWCQTNLQNTMHGSEAPKKGWKKFKFKKSGKGRFSRLKA